MFGDYRRHLTAQATSTSKQGRFHALGHDTVPARRFLTFVAAFWRRNQLGKSRTGRLPRITSPGGVVQTQERNLGPTGQEQIVLDQSLGLILIIQS